MPARLRSVSRPGDKVVADYQLISEIRAFDIAAGTGRRWSTSPPS